MVILRLISASTTLFSAKPPTQPTPHFTKGSTHKFAAGALIFAIVFALEVVLSASANAQTFTVLHSFKNSPDGDIPYTGLVMDAKGNLYGTTFFGGAGGCSPTCGAIFTTRDGGDRVLYSFTGVPDGASPSYGNLFRDSKGHLYGTTVYGGTGNCSSQVNGCGTVFMVSGTKETVLYSFSGPPDGKWPTGNLVMDSAGNLYGATNGGGAHQNGTVFKVDTSGNEIVLYNFCSVHCVDGAGPSAGLIMDAAGNLYGTTSSGGAYSHGTVFKVDTSGNEIVLHSFCTQGKCRDGSQPGDGVLLMDARGNLYGTTSSGGSHNSGTVFKLNKSGIYTVLHNFASDSKDGILPFSGLVMDTAGNLYGTTFEGGAGSKGTVFKMDPKGGETVLYNFCSQPQCADGANPVGSLVMDAAGNFYGTTSSGGTHNNGTAFELTP